MAKGLKGFERKGIKAQKTDYGFLLFCNKNHQPSFMKIVQASAKIIFYHCYVFFPSYKHSLFVNIIF